MIANTYQLTVDLDCWIRRRRLRMCYWRQWRKPRTKVRALLKCGVNERLAISCGITSKGSWRSAKTKGINLAINNEFLAQQGLVSLREIWTLFITGSEPPCAEPYAGWCGGWGLIPPATRLYAFNHQM